MPEDNLKQLLGLQIHLGHADMKMTMRYLATMQVAESIDTESEVEFNR